MILKALLIPALLPAFLADLPPADPSPPAPGKALTQEHPAPPSEAETGCSGVLVQGGLIVCQGEPGTRFRLGDTELTVDASAGDASAGDASAGVAFGLGRKADGSITIEITPPEGATQTMTFDIALRRDETTVLRGIDCDKIDARTEEQKAHANRSWLKKQTGWQSFHDGRGGLDGFIRPAEGPVSSPFGYVRKYVTEGCPTKERPHFGYDIAAPTGAPIIAPAGGTVTLAEPDLYYEGGTVFLDHGQGLVSLFLHMSELDVQVGDVLEAGDPIGKIGATGRVTGAHLHWAVKWRDTSRAERDRDFYIDPALLLDLPRSPAQ